MTDRTAVIGSPSWWRRRPTHIGGATSRAGLVVLALALVLFFQWRSDNFATAANLLTIMVNVAGILVVSIAMARLMIAGQIDLSVGGSFALLAVTGAWVMRETGSVALGLAAGVGGGLVLGLFNGWLVLRLGISPIIVTLAMLGVYSGLAFVITGSAPIYQLPEAISVLGRMRVAGVPAVVVIAVVLFVVGALALTRTVGGVRSYAIGGSPRAAAAMGVDVERHLLLLYAYVGASVGIVAMLTLARLGSASPNLGIGFELDVVTAVILGGVGFAGGTGRPIGVFFGVLTIGILSAGLIFVGVSDYWQTIVRGGVLLLALAADQLTDRWRRRRVRGGPRERTGGGEEYAGAAEEAFREELRAHVPPGPVALSATHLAKSYGAVTAVSDVSLELRSGQVTCLLGDNGAGKSTVIKMLSGVVRPDSGDIRLAGHGSLVGVPAIDVRHLGVETVYQDLAVCANLGAAYNLSLGREPRRVGRGSLAPFDTATAVREAQQRLAALGIVLDDPLRPVESLSGGQRQCVAIARTEIAGVKVVVLDEPTAALGVRQRSLVLRLARRLADGGAAVVVITHDVESVTLLADRVVVLSLGRVAFDGPAESISARRLVHLMAGLPLDPEPDAPDRASAPV